MKVLDAIKERRSIRSFLDKDVSDDNIAQLLEACRWAPSAGNRQPWEVIIVRDEEMRKKLSSAALRQRFVQMAPVVLVMAINKKLAKATYGDRGIDLYAIQSTAAACQNIHLAAHSLGLGTCWVGAFDEDEVARLLNFPEHLRPIALIPIGWPSERPEAPPRHEPDEFSWEETIER